MSDCKQSMRPELRRVLDTYTTCPCCTVPGCFHFNPYTFRYDPCSLCELIADRQNELARL